MNLLEHFIIIIFQYSILIVSFSYSPNNLMYFILPMCIKTKNPLLGQHREKGGGVGRGEGAEASLRCTKGGNFIYPMMNRFILYYLASERT